MIRVGDVRPSQLMFSFGVGSLLDLPQFSALVMGLDSWQESLCPEVAERRLLAALQRRFGCQLTALRLPPVHEDSMESNGGTGIGVPVTVFPRWLRCTLCDTIAPVDSGAFKLKRDLYRPDRVGYVHDPCNVNKYKTNPPRAVPVRFLLACSNGHLSDIPWIDFVHDWAPCNAGRPSLVMREFGAAGDASDIEVRCLECGAKKRLGLIFGPRSPFLCEKLHPHLRFRESDACNGELKVVNLGASTLWFQHSLSVLSIPDSESVLEALVRNKWEDLKDARNVPIVQYLASPQRIPELMEFTPEEIVAAIERHHQNLTDPPSETAYDVKLPEWLVLAGVNHLPAGNQNDLELDEINPPVGLEHWFEPTIRVHRLREVRALYGFSRLQTQQDLELGLENSVTVAPITRGNPTWLPACEIRGEGIFIRLKEEIIQSWERSPNIVEADKLFFNAHKAWRASRKFSDPEAGYPGIRFVLIHSLAHAIMRQIALDCGYTAASIRERLYCRTQNHAVGPMAGFLLFTAASDSEGTLGGLVALSDPNVLSRNILQALENIRICASDPLCAEMVPAAEGRGIHGASCHACLFSPETSCECGNKYLDRNLLIETLSQKHQEFFTSL